MDYCNDHHFPNELWVEIDSHYSDNKRYYHTLTHLNNILHELQEIKVATETWNAILFSVYYHDIVYNASRQDNEEKSAEFAEKRLRRMEVPDEIITKCKGHILATKKHNDNTSMDTNYFIDADLSILGQNWDAYNMYRENIRKEYSIYPNIIYNQGRKKVLKHFMKMERIYKTPHFFNKFELQARQNISNELKTF